MSKFRGLLNAIGKPEPDPPSQELETQKPSGELPELHPKIEPKRGRPKGKRSDSNYEQVTAYIRKSTHAAVKIELLKNSQKGAKQEFSELIQELLEEWLKSRT